MSKTKPSLTTLAAATALALCCGAALAQDVKLAAVYEGTWVNLEERASNNMKVTIDKVEADGSITGTYHRFAVFCSARGIPMKGKLEGNKVTLLPDFTGNARCADTKWDFELQPDGKLAGLGNSYFRLKAELSPGK